MADAVDMSQFAQFIKALRETVGKTDTIVVLHLQRLGAKTMAFARAELKDIEYTGGLAGSFVVETNHPALQVSVFPQIKRAVFTRRGTKPHFAPIGPLKLWAQVKLGDKNLAYPIQKSIAKEGTSIQSLRKRGTKSNPWPERVTQRSDFNQAVEKTMKDIAQKIEVSIVDS